MEECSTCKFFRRGANAYGQCVRFPIVAEKHQADYCGEYKPEREPQLREPSTTSTGIAKPKNAR